MIVLKSPAEIEKMRVSNRIVAEVLLKLDELIVPGVTTAELDRIAEEEILKRGAKPAFKGYMGYKHTLCTSRNEEVVHGIPSDVELREGDIVGIDCGVVKNDFYGDHAKTFAVGKISEEASRLLRVTEEALMAGIEQALSHNRLYDISAAVQQHAEAAGYTIVRDYVGHGIGRKLHEDPQLPNFGKAGTGIPLRPGLVLAIEPMINQGGCETEVLEDDWTVVTKDRKLSAHFEHSVAITENGPDILSKL
ncbi:MAG: type I methionyl aminopeptidase [Deltaproteobacteria bacterium CG_4_10_14_0_2_um_filter_43_8]|nr:MAG: type I methionyl aminopeptidase [Deltaproteobacteria bacterium CG11_big_fil_rev_8_21_14_0_20_42_23]PJA21587.1 MAG: type I methionyl aminopeptidase [Deltaproteobacteria bacterium CG_4_10_14_0_2_um_filter_43_8]PJC64615.1 MAG: type I methionyl aminopeptidase [Deltaproteobacteria bacterium CG_4_9_14_0_2_um_filter_42_21]